MMMTTLLTGGPRADMLATLQDLMALAWSLLHDLALLVSRFVGIPDLWLGFLG